MAKEYQLRKEEKKIRRCFKCDNKEHIAKDCKATQSIKKQKVQEELNNEDKKKKQGFGNNLKQAQYKRSPM